MGVQKISMLIPPVLSAAAVSSSNRDTDWNHCFLPTAMALLVGATSVEGDDVLVKASIDNIHVQCSSSLEDTTVNIEKGPQVQQQEDELPTKDEPFPQDEASEIESQQFTVRAVFVGCVLGGLISASKCVQHPLDPLFS